MNEATSETYSWQVRLFARDPRKLYGVLFACIVGAIAGLLLFRSVGFALIGFVVIATATAEYWLPQNYKLDRNGASARCGISVSAIQWSDVKQVIPDDRGVKLSPLTGEGRMSEFRGVYLRFNDNRDQVLSHVQGNTSSIASQP